MVFFVIIFELSIMVINICHQNELSIAFIFTPVLNVFSYAIITVILVLETKKDQHYSVFRACFWFIALICYSLLFRSKILELTDNLRDDHILEFVFFFLKFTFIISNFLIEFVPKQSNSFLTKKNPESNASLFSWLIFGWITRYIFVIKNNFIK